MAAQIVTLLFTDLSGSSALLQRLGDDAGEQMRRRHFGILREAVGQTGGQEVKNLGDGLMVVFESAVAATRCAIAMQRAISRHNASGGLQLGVRVGMHVGEPVRDEDDYFGAAVVVAKRLCDAADPGQILASDLVRSLVSPKSGFAFVPVGEIPLKGMDEPVAAFSLDWREQTQDGRPSLDATTTRVPLVAREDHLHRLDAEVRQAAAGNLRVVLLLGEAGFGKTRLAAEVVSRHREEVIALSARAYPLGATASLGLWVEALEKKLRTYPRDALLELCRGHLEDLSALLPSVRAVATTQPEGDPPRIRLLGALATLLERLTDESTVVVTLDDVHLADGSSWEALNYLSRNLCDTRLLVLMAARPTELREHPVAVDVVRGLEQEGLLTRVPVTPLSPEAIRELAEELVADPVPDALVQWLADRAEGSPLFVTGLTRALLEEQADLARPSLRTLPEDLAERVHTRIRNLDSRDRAVLELLAVIGYQAELGDLMRLSGQTLDELGEILERLQRARLVAEIEEDHDLLYEIAHPLIQEAIYGQIGGARRRALHRHAARALVAGGRYGAAASHIMTAADPGDDEAVTMLCEALRQAEAGEHHREALALLEALLTILPAGDDRWRKVVDVMPLTPEWVVDHRADASAEVGVKAMRRAEVVLDRAGDLRRRAAVKFSLGSLLAWGVNELDAGQELLEAARRLFLESDDGRTALLATNEIGYQRGMADDHEAHEAAAREVLREAEKTGDSFLELQALCSLAWMLNMTGRLDEAVAVIDRALAVAASTERIYRQSYLLGMKAEIGHQLGYSRSVRDLDEAREMNPAFRDTLILGFTAQISYRVGDLRRAVGAVVDQRAWDGGLSPRRAAGASSAVVSLAEMGRADEAEELQASMDAALRGRPCWGMSRISDSSRAVAASLSSGREEAMGLLAAVVEDAIGHGYWGPGRWMIADLAEAAAYTGDTERSGQCLDLMAVDPHPQEGLPQEALRHFVTGAASMGRSDASETTAMLEQAAQEFGVAGWRMMEGRSKSLLGAHLARIDRNRALSVLEEATALFDEFEATVRLQWCAEISSAIGARGRRKGSDLLGPGALSAREREVAKLAAAGCSAREIAQRLFIGERTVETHLANAYAKLGVSSKLELVRRAGELGL